MNNNTSSMIDEAIHPIASIDRSIKSGILSVKKTYANVENIYQKRITNNDMKRMSENLGIILSKCKAIYDLDLNPKNLKVRVKYISPNTIYIMHTNFAKTLVNSYNDILDSLYSLDFVNNIKTFKKDDINRHFNDVLVDKTLDEIYNITGLELNKNRYRASHKNLEWVVDEFNNGGITKTISSDDIKDLKNLGTDAVRTKIKIGFSEHSRSLIEAYRPVDIILNTTLSKNYIVHLKKIYIKILKYFNDIKVDILDADLTKDDLDLAKLFIEESVKFSENLMNMYISIFDILQKYRTYYFINLNDTVNAVLETKVKKRSSI